MFKKFFGKEEDEEEVFETVDPVLEQRRKEKFSAPLIYSEEVAKDEKEEKEEKKTPVVPEKKTTLPTTEASYRMSEIISPIDGVKKAARTEVKVAKPKVKKIKKEVDDLIPIISPFYGPANSEEEIETIKEESHIEETSVVDNLRNIAQIVEEEQDQLKIIEERTGEFKLDFQNQEEDSFIDEIDDSMSLDELMNLYEKKFKD